MTQEQFNSIVKKIYERESKKYRSELIFAISNMFDSIIKCKRLADAEGEEFDIKSLIHDTYVDIVKLYDLFQEEQTFLSRYITIRYQSYQRKIDIF